MDLPATSSPSMLRAFSLQTRGEETRMWNARVKQHARALARVRRALNTSLTFQGGSSKHSHYLQRLRIGTRFAGVSIRSMSSGDLRAQRASAAALVNHHVHTEVASEAARKSIPFWLQGDAMLQTADKMLERQRLRFDPQVLSALQSFWAAAQRSMQSGGEVNADSLNFRGYTIMMRRIYRLMIEKYDVAESEATIAEDWANDANGADVLNRHALCDSLFEVSCTAPTHSMPAAAWHSWMHHRLTLR